MTDISTYTTTAQCVARLAEIEPEISNLAQAGAGVKSHEDHDTLQLYLREQQGLRHRIFEIENGIE